MHFNGGYGAAGSPWPLAGLGQAPLGPRASRPLGQGQGPPPNPVAVGRAVEPARRRTTSVDLLRATTRDSTGRMATGMQTLLMAGPGGPPAGVAAPAGVPPPPPKRNKEKRLSRTVRLFGV